MTIPTPRSTTAAADAQIPAHHPFAQHLQRVAALPATRRLDAGRRPPAQPLPQPRRPDAVRDDRLDDAAARLGPVAARPRAILIVSAHWESAPLS